MVRHSVEKRLRVERLGQNRHRTGLACGLEFVRVPGGGERNHASLRIRGTEAASGLDTTETRHVQIHQHRVRIKLEDEPDAFDAVSRPTNKIKSPVQFEVDAQQLCERIVVVDEHDTNSHHHTPRMPIEI